MEYTGNRGDIRSQPPFDADFLTSSPSVARYPIADQLHVLQSAIAAAPCGMAICNRFGRLLLANGAMGEMFGYVRADLLPRDLRTIIPDLASSADMQGSASGSPARDLEGLRKDGSPTPIRVSVSPVVVHSESLFAVSIVDISDERRHEARVALLESQAAVQALISDLRRAAPRRRSTRSTPPSSRCSARSEKHSASTGAWLTYPRLTVRPHTRRPTAGRATASECH